MKEIFIGIFAAVGFFGLTFVLMMGVSLLMTYPTMWAWNYVMPYLFGLKTITFWQAFSLNVLGGMFFKSSNTNNCKKD